MLFYSTGQVKCKEGGVVCSRSVSGLLSLHVDIHHVNANLKNWRGYPDMGFPRSSVGKESAWNAGDSGPIPGSGRSPGEGNGNPLQHSGLENPMDGEAHGVARVRHGSCM